MKMRVYRPFLFAVAFGGVATFMFARTATAQGQQSGQTGQAQPTNSAQTPKKQKPVETTTTPDAGSIEKVEPISTGPIRLDNPKYGKVVFHTEVGSFKVLGSDPRLVDGKIEFSFKGTVLVSDLEPGSKLTVTGDVRKEFTTDDKTKEVYFGQGKMTVLGRFRSIQFFGQKLAGNFIGWGIFRFVGEFDKKLQTGFYTLNDNPQTPWGTSINEVHVGNSEETKTEMKVKIRPKGG